MGFFYKTHWIKNQKILFLILFVIALGGYLSIGKEAPFHGLQGRYYSNLSWQGPPALVKLDPEVSTAVLKERREELGVNRFSVRWEGYIEVRKSGEYQFRLESDDGSRLYIREQLVVDNAGGMGLQKAMGDVSLDPGLHPVRVEYVQGGGLLKIEVKWGKKEKALSELKAENLFPISLEVEKYERLKRIQGVFWVLMVLSGVGLTYKTLPDFLKVFYELLRRLPRLWAKSFSLPTAGVLIGFALVILVFFYDILFLDYSLLTGGPPTKPHHVIDPSASALQHEPYTQFASKAYKNGWIPLWNPHSALGSPLNGHMHTAVFFPPHLPLFLNPSDKMWDTFMILRILSAGLLAYAFFRRFLSLDRPPAFFGAAAFMLSGHLILNLNMVYINAVVLLPGLLYTSELLLAVPKLRNLLLTAVFVGLIILGGHPEATFFALFYGSVYYLFRWITEVKKRDSALFSFFFYKQLFLFAVAVLLGFLLSAIALIPFLEFVQLADIGVHGTEHKVGLLTVSPSYLFGLWVPYFWGPINDAWDGLNWQIFPGYIGLLVAVFVTALCLQGFAFQGKSLFFVAMVLFFLLKGYGLSSSLNEWVGNLPAFRVSFFTRYFPGEFMFSTAALTGIFLQRLGEGRVRLRYVILSTVLGFVSLGGLLALYYPRLMELKKLDYAIRQIRPPAIFCLLLGVTMELRYVRQRIEERGIEGREGEGKKEEKKASFPTPPPFSFPSPLSLLLPTDKTLTFIFGLLLILELFIWMPKIHHKRSDLIPYQDPPAHIKFIRQDPGIFRVYGLDTFLFPSTASGYGLDDFGAVDALFYRRYTEFSQKLFRPYEGYFNGFSVPNVENRFFSFLNLKYLVTAPWTPPPAPFFTLVYQQEANVYRNEQAFP
ncbi:MAG TPA: PA14 domain-containing protein, partial [Candidatus Limnocylindrales bacterium]|nr:PA14 domain-containing protein [Candidatus Limnocylindrales bacterium]